MKSEKFAIAKKGFFYWKGNLEKTSSALIKWIGSPAFLLVNTALFVGFFILRQFGIITELVFSFLVGIICLEAIYLAIFIRMIVRKNCRNISQMRENIEEVSQEEKDAHKAMLSVLHLSHQIKTLQQDVEILKKHGLIKSTLRNGHRVHI